MPTTTTNIQDADRYTAHLATLDLPDWLRYEVAVRPRRRAVGLTVKPGGAVVVAVPPGVPPERVGRFIRSHITWLVRNVRDREENAPAYPVKELVNGAGFAWLGTNHRLRLVDDTDSTRPCPCMCRRPLTRHPGVPIVAEDGHSTWSGYRTRQLTLRRDAASAATIIGWYRREGLAWALDVAGPYADRLRLDLAALTVEVRDIGRRRWGNYKPAAHRVRLHWAIFQLPRPLAEYLIVHELAHATRPGGKPHGRQWERVMDRVMFDWRDRRARLGKDGASVWMGDVTSPAGEPAPVSVVNGPHPPSPTVTRCDVGGEALPRDAAWWLVSGPGRGWESDSGAACHTHCGQPPAAAVAAHSTRPVDGYARAIEAAAEQPGTARDPWAVYL